ncbi:MAG: hypothetical protein DRO18_07355 [Thermoprotei archaeon]|nr:MAG: hypothetical protein DRO18_07355 [Thermoprotei archaeon]
MKTIDLILEALTDGEPHDVEELLKETSLSREKLQLVLDFLSKYNFVRYDRQRGVVRINEDTRRWIKSVEEASLT